MDVGASCRNGVRGGCHEGAALLKGREKRMVNGEMVEIRREREKQSAEVILYIQEHKPPFPTIMNLLRSFPFHKAIFVITLRLANHITEYCKDCTAYFICKHFPI